MTHERHVYTEDCAGCQIAIVDPSSGAPLPKDHPAMAVALKVWWATSLADRAACQRVWVWNSRAGMDVAAANRLAERLEIAMRSAGLMRG